MTDREGLENAYRSALNDAAKQLSYRGLSTNALRGKLLDKGYSEDAADYALAWLTERNLLNDSRFAEAMISSYTRRGYGKLRIRQELRKRGVCSEDLESAIEDYVPDTNSLKRMLHKKLCGDLSDPKAIQRTVAYLQRRGFQWDDIRLALREYETSLCDEDAISLEF